ncbi:MAG: hypothetical protein methR_P3878 [Methyloprofundus sp.]|nr:MAG: hypothetical protein methR_P3878 [Methyloprofundus sp.]
MVTDIHEWSIADAEHTHAAFSTVQIQPTIDMKVATECHEQHEGVCSYDHGGHIGQTLATRAAIAIRIPAPNITKAPLYSDFYYSRYTTPKLRPPIA